MIGPRLLNVVALLAVVAFAASARADDVPDFNRDIQPILSDNCYHCHGPDSATRKAELRLDQEKSAFTPNKKGQVALVAGKPQESQLLRRILSTDKDEVMPPPDSNRHLSAKEIGLLKRWVEGGAKWGKHWAFAAPVRPEVPKVQDERWPRNAVDRFILAKLDKEGLNPSPETSKEKLLRRVTLDLTGLPPAPAEVEAFVADQSPDAYEKVVDRLLASPRYGERMVFEWLDAARYSDTNGYQGDPTRSMWPWRDWAVRAMNENMPYDRFVTAQLAGDLLPNATDEDRLATGFNRNHTYNGEGGRIAEETRVENVMDRVETFGTVFLGLTVGCTRCHDHKFDPITQREYYGLYAYFNQCSENGQLKYETLGNAAPVLVYGPKEQREKLAAAKTVLAQAEAKLKAAMPAVDAAQAEWERLGTASASTGEWTVVKPSKITAQNPTRIHIQDDGVIVTGGSYPASDVYEINLHTELVGVTSLRIEALPHPSLPLNGPGRSLDTGNFVLTDLSADAAPANDAKAGKPVLVTSAYATYAQDGFPAAAAIDRDAKSGWAVWKAPDRNGISATFGFAEPIGFVGGTEVKLRFAFESGHVGHLLGCFRLSFGTGPALPADVIAALQTPAEKRDGKRKDRLRDYFRTTLSPEYIALNNDVARAKSAVEAVGKDMPRVMVMDDAKPRDTFLLKRGAYDKPDTTAKVDFTVPAVLNPLPAGAPKNRLALAKWLTDPANPLLARVTVNRYWQAFFGTGLVKTAEDFGVQGEKPVNPELLDWLAVEFRESGWNVKALHRLIVTSSAYRQSSKVAPASYERDPENRLLARGPRHRLPSFMIRDAALAVSGLLVERVGGPPVKPYQPPGVWEEMSLDQIKYVPDRGEANWRRSVYTFWRRTVAPTTMFDVPQRTACSVRTVRTNTPLHALALLNDVTYVEAGRVLAERLLRDQLLATPEQKVDHAFRLATARKPTDAEQAVLLNAVERLRKQYAADAEGAKKLINLGDKARDANLNDADLAAWASVVGMIMNLDEAISQE
jgi:hypothetical protein